MTIRLATAADLPAMVALGRATHAVSRYAAQPYSAARVQQGLQAVIDSGQGKYVLFAAVDSGRQVVGLLLGVIEQALFTEALSASVVYYIVDSAASMGGHAPRLLRAFERWALNRGAVEVNFGVNSGIDAGRVARYARRMGYGWVGGNFVKEVK